MQLCYSFLYVRYSPELYELIWKTYFWNWVMSELTGLTENRRQFCDKVTDAKWSTLQYRQIRQVIRHNELHYLGLDYNEVNLLGSVQTIILYNLHSMFEYLPVPRLKIISKLIDIKLKLGL